MAAMFIDLHLLQTVPPSNLNRDDSNSPKTAIYGGVRRSRVSSQAWKRAMRNEFHNILDTENLGVRSVRLPELVAARIPEYTEATPEESLEKAKEVLQAAGIKVVSKKKTKDADESLATGYLVFLSQNQISNLAELAAQSLKDGSEIDKTQAKKFAQQENSVDIALFGRMVADVADLNVDASVQVAHAISVHAVDNEYDYYTATDDVKQASENEDAGAAMIGTIEFNSSTLYRYATINVDGLQANLGDPEATARAVEAFVKSMIVSMPTGKQNTFANRTLPDAVVVQIRTDQPVNFAGAFEEPVRGENRIKHATERLVEYAVTVQEAFGLEPAQVWTIASSPNASEIARMGAATPLPEVVQQVGAAVRSSLSGAA